MSVKPSDLLALHAPTPPDQVKIRQGPGGKSLSYVDSRYVAQFLDDTVGPANWQRRSTIGPNGKVSCAIGIRVAQPDGTTEWVFKDDGADETDIEGAKGSFSDAFKRAAAISWGIARDLYGDQRTPPARLPVAPPPAVTAGGEPPLDWDSGLAPVRPAAVVPSSAPQSDEDFCPDHRARWALKPGGISKSTNKPYDPFWACPSNERPFCKNKPSKAWQARQETVA